MAKLNVKALGLALGIVWGAVMFLMGLAGMFSEWGGGIREVMSSLYIGYKPTLPGSVIGGIWGFVDAGIGGIVIAWLYNKFQK